MADDGRFQRTGFVQFKHTVQRSSLELFIEGSVRISLRQCAAAEYAPVKSDLIDRAENGLDHDIGIQSMPEIVGVIHPITGDT